MVQRSLKPCKQRGCKNLTRDITGYCNEHIEVYETKRAQLNKEYDKYIRKNRDKEYTNFYHSDSWQNLREDVLTTYKYIDVYSYYIENKVVIASIGHHIVELKEDWSKRLDIDNIFPLSDYNHKKIHALYKNDKRGTQRLLRELLERFRKQFSIPPLP